MPHNDIPLQFLSKVKFPHHGIGVVINEKTVIEEDVTIFQNVSIVEKDGKAPTIKRGVTIYPNSVIVGGVTIGVNAMIGAGSVVLTDVPENAVMAGNPAKVIK
jgi:serine acetyltransferase